MQGMGPTVNNAVMHSKGAQRTDLRGYHHRNVLCEVMEALSDCIVGNFSYDICVVSHHIAASDLHSYM